MADAMSSFVHFGPMMHGYVVFVGPDSTSHGRCVLFVFSVAVGFVYSPFFYEAVARPDAHKKYNGYFFQLLLMMS